MKSPTRLKKVQKLMECVTALSRFISRTRERGLPVFKLLKKSDHFLWTPETEAAFQDFKRY